MATPDPSQSWPVPNKGLPTTADIRGRARAGHVLPNGMPLGPWAHGKLGFAEGFLELRGWAAALDTGGGAFGLRKNTGVKLATPYGKRGATQAFSCTRQGNAPAVNADAKRESSSEKCGCPFYVVLEESVEGVVVSNMHEDACKLPNFHNHGLKLDREQANAASGGSLRYFPDDIMKTGKLLASIHLKPGAIYEALSSLCLARGDEVTFTYLDVANAFAPTGAARTFDATNLFAKLQEREKLKGLMFDIEIDASASDEGLTRVFFEIDGAQELWESCGGKVLIFDTKHGTQRYGLKLALLVTVDNNGTTRILAVSLVRHEDEPSFSWVFRAFEKCFGKPKVLFTDSDKGMSAALRATWRDVMHLLCTWHLFKNFYENIRPFFVNKATEWHQLARFWWALCKDSDVSTRASFDASWGEIIDFVKKHAPASEKLNEKVAWLECMGAKQRQWAACWTWDLCTFGVHSTQVRALQL
jgi:hypothetical protein